MFSIELELISDVLSPEGDQVLSMRIRGRWILIFFKVQLADTIKSQYLANLPEVATVEIRLSKGSLVVTVVISLPKIQACAIEGIATNLESGDSRR